jgi:hypothetical protein
MNEINNIQEELKDMGSPLAEVPMEMPYSVPVDYFEQLASGMAGKAREKEGEVPDFGRALPYTTPAGYFDGLAAAMLQKVTAQDKKITVAPDKGVAFFPVIRWAAAAALVAIIGSGAFIMFSGNHETGAERMLAKVPPNEIKEYMQHHYGFDASKVANNTHISNLDVDSKDIVAYLDETGWE